MNVFTLKYQMVDVLHNVIKMVSARVVLWVEDMSALAMLGFLGMVSTANVSRVSRSNLTPCFKFKNDNNARLKAFFLLDVKANSQASSQRVLSNIVIA